MTLLIHSLPPRPLQSCALIPAPSAIHSSRQNAARIAVLLLAIAILNAIDLAYTLFAHRMGWLTEINPIARAFLSLGFTQTLICYKILTVIVGSLMLWKLRAHRWTPSACWVVIMAYTCLAAWWYLWAAEMLRMYDSHRLL